VDRRTDVYSLGATLWELLTLRPIFGVSEETPTPDLMLKIQTTDADPPRKYNRHVPRDLEAIVMKCLEKDRARRYTTAADLAADLGRFLGGEAVNAQPPSLTYMLGKFVRRHRVALAVTALVMTLLLGSAVAAFVGIDRERRATLEKNAELERQAYANRIAVAERELTLNQDIGLASSLLEKCPPQLRGWEWDYLMRLRDGGRAPLKGHEGGLWNAEFSPDGRHVATASIDGTAKIWDAATGKEVNVFRGHALPQVPFLKPPPRLPVTCLAYSPDGRFLATGSLFPNVTDLTNPRKAYGVVKVWDAKTLKVTATFSNYIGMVNALTFSPDGKRVASASVGEEKILAVWDAGTGADVHVFRDNLSHVHQVRYSPDGRLLVAGFTDGSVKIWDAATFETVRTIKAHPAPVYGLAFARDGARFASAGFDGTICVWDTATGVLAMTLRGHTGAAMGIAFSPDGRRIASAGFDKTVRLWDAATGEEKLTLRGHKELVSSVTFSPDGQQVLSASFDKEARIWDASPAPVPAGPGVFTLGGHTDRVNVVAFSKDRRFLASNLGRPQGRRLGSGVQSGRQARGLRQLGPHRQGLGDRHRQGGVCLQRARSAGPRPRLQSGRQAPGVHELGWLRENLGRANRQGERHECRPPVPHFGRGLQPRRQVRRFGQRRPHCQNMGCGHRPRGSRSERPRCSRPRGGFQPGRQAYCFRELG
jgi:WD40 repeat protein